MWLCLGARRVPRLLDQFVEVDNDCDNQDNEIENEPLFQRHGYRFEDCLDGKYTAQR
jgi:hypothetical protein